MTTALSTTPLSPDDLQAFGRELDELLQRTRADLGERDVRYVRRVIRLQRGLELAGRVLLQASPWVLPAWPLGVAALAASKIIENMEVGHNVLHGQYEFTGDPALSSAGYEWDTVCPADQWRHSHNYLHHTFTNVEGVDHDLGYRLLRVTDGQPWRWPAVFQPVYAAVLATFFQWGIAAHDVDMPRYLTEPSTRTAEDRAKVRGLLRKAWRQVRKDYLLFPLLAGPGAPIVLAGNVAANLLRNLWSFAVIFCGHFPEGTATFSPDALATEGRAGFYVRQLLGSANFDGSPALHFFSGHLSHQIEHHLFPDVPAHRYPELAVQVRAIAARYGLPYNTRSFGAQLWSVAKLIARKALPPTGGVSGARGGVAAG